VLNLTAHTTVLFSASYSPTGVAKGFGAQSTNGPEVKHMQLQSAGLLVSTPAAVAGLPNADEASEINSCMQLKSEPGLRRKLSSAYSHCLHEREI
jgi:hypothetical protein